MKQETYSCLDFVNIFSFAQSQHVHISNSFIFLVINTKYPSTAFSISAYQDNYRSTLTAMTRFVCYVFCWNEGEKRQINFHLLSIHIDMGLGNKHERWKQNLQVHWYWPNNHDQCHLFNSLFGNRNLVCMFLNWA